MTLLFAFRWITKKIDGVFYELFVFLFWQWLTEVFVQGALCQKPLPQGVCRHVCVCNAAACGSCVRSDWEVDQHATSALMFISLMLKWDTALCSVCLHWWDNTWATPQTQASEPVDVWELWYRSDLFIMNGVKKKKKGWARFYQELVCFWSKSNELLF